MAHEHKVVDTDSRFVIDKATREISTGYGYTNIMQYDHNSERLTFQMPKMIDGHDMTQCNEVQVHYINIDSSTRDSNVGVYGVEDLHTDPEDENSVVLSWLVSGNATKFAGVLNFLIKFKCVVDGVVEYAWNTAIYKGMTVSNGIDNGEIVAEEYADILGQWEERIQAMEYGIGMVKTVNGNTPDENGNVEAVDEPARIRIEDLEKDQAYVTPRKYGAKGDGVTDDTSAIQQCLNENNNVYFPEGRYRITTPLTVRSGKNITGATKYHSIIFCDGCDAIHFAGNGERGNFRSLGFFGDNSDHSAFVFNNNAVVWGFDDLWCREFGNSFFLANHNGNVNNIVIQNSQFEYGGKNCIEFIYSANSQINNVVVRACDISGFPSGNAIAITGNNILIEGCTIQAVDMGIRIDSTLSNDTTHPYHDSNGINIFSNYFEQVKKSYVFANVNYTAEHSGFLSGLTIIGNYGSRATDADPEYPAVKIATDKDIYSKNIHNPGSMIGGVLYAGNSLAAGAGNVLIDGGGILTRNCVIVPDSISGSATNPYALNNMGKAIVINRYKTNTKTLRLYKGLLPDGATATNESVTIPAESKFYYTIDDNTIKELPLQLTFENTPKYGIYVRLHRHLKNGETLVDESYVEPPSDGSLTVNYLLEGYLFCGYPDHTNEDFEDYDLEINPLSGPVTITNPVIEYFE